MTSDPDIPPGKPGKLVREKHNEVNKEEIEPPLGNPEELEEDENEMKEDENDNSTMNHFRAAMSFMKKIKNKNLPSTFIYHHERYSYDTNSASCFW